MEGLLLILLEYLRQFQGILGALLGVITTFTLTYIFRNRGKIYFFFSKWSNSFHSWKEGREIELEPENLEDASSFNYGFNIEIYNNSEVPKILRGIKVKFTCANGILEDTPYIALPFEEHWQGKQSKPISNVNIPPKQVISYRLYGFISNENIEYVKDIQAVHFIALNHKNKEFKKLIKNFRM